MTDDEAQSDEALFATITANLADAAERALGPWVEATVGRFTDAAHESAAEAGRAAAIEVGAELRQLVGVDVDEQRTTPLAIIRRAGRFPNAVLAAAGVPAPVRDPFDVRNDPDDTYGVNPVTWSDLGEEVGGLGITWGAAKAHLHLRRHKG